MNLSQLVQRVSKRTGYPLSETRVICDELIQAIREELFQGHDVRISKLGNFYWRALEARTLRHPGTGETFAAAPRLRLRFRAALDLQKGLTWRKE